MTTRSLDERSAAADHRRIDMLGRIINSLRGPGDDPWGHGKWLRKVPLVGAVVLIPMLASAVAQAFQTRGAEKAAAPQAAKPDDQKPVVVKRGAEKPAAGQPGGFFTGSAGVDRLFPAEEPARVAIASVTFEPGARTAWHSHPLGQTLVVTEGTGWVQGWGGKVQEIKAGDVVHTPPNQKHWHGATATTRMKHISVVEHLDGKNVEVMEPVSDEQYRP
jgi:quercetin dioxygenase-like cupin family protein